MYEKGISLFSVEIFLSHSAEKNRRRILICFEKILVSKIFIHRRVEGIKVLSKFFLSHRTEKLHKGSLLCFRNFLVRKRIYG